VRRREGGGKRKGEEEKGGNQSQGKRKRRAEGSENTIPYYPKTRPKQIYYAISREERNGSKSTRQNTECGTGVRIQENYYKRETERIRENLGLIPIKAAAWR